MADIPSKLIAKFAKNGREEVRISVDVYKGRPLVNLRVWYMHMETGELQPGKQGITVPVDKVDALLIGIQELKNQLKAGNTATPG